MSDQNLTIFERYKALGEGRMIIDNEDLCAYKLSEIGICFREALEDPWVFAGINIINDPDAVFQLYTEPVELHDWAWAIEKMQKGEKVRWHEWDNLVFVQLDGINLRVHGNYGADIKFSRIEYFIEKGWRLYV